MARKEHLLEESFFKYICLCFRFKESEISCQIASWKMFRFHYHFLLICAAAQLHQCRQHFPPVSRTKAWASSLCPIYETPNESEIAEKAIKELALMKCRQRKAKGGGLRYYFQRRNQLGFLPLQERDRPSDSNRLRSRPTQSRDREEEEGKKGASSRGDAKYFVRRLRQIVSWALYVCLAVCVAAAPGRTERKRTRPLGPDFEYEKKLHRSECAIANVAKWRWRISSPRTAHITTSTFVP